MGRGILVFALALKLVASSPYYPVDIRSRQYDLQPNFVLPRNDVTTTTVEVEETVTPRRLSSQVREPTFIRDDLDTYWTTRDIYEQDWVKLQSPLQNRETIYAQYQTPITSQLETEIKTVPIVQETVTKTINSPLRVVKDDDYILVNNLRNNIDNNPLIQTQREIVREDVLPSLQSSYETLPLGYRDERVIYKQRLENPESNILVRKENLVKPLPVTTRVEADIEVVPAVVKETTVEVDNTPILKTRESRLSVPAARTNLDTPIIRNEKDVVVDTSLPSLGSSKGRIPRIRQSKRLRLSQNPSNDFLSRIKSVDNIQPVTTYVEATIQNSPNILQESTVQRLDTNVNRNIYDNSEANPFVSRYITPVLQKQRAVIYDSPLQRDRIIYDNPFEDISVSDQYVLRSRPVATRVEQEILTVPTVAQETIRQYDYSVPNEDTSVSNQYILKSRPVATRLEQDKLEVKETVREYDYSLPSPLRNNQQLPLLQNGRQIALKRIIPGYYDNTEDINDISIRDTQFYDDYVVKSNPITTRVETDLQLIPAEVQSYDVNVRGISEYDNSFYINQSPLRQNKRDVFVYRNNLPEIRSSYITTSPNLQKETLKISRNPLRNVLLNEDVIAKSRPVATISEDIQATPALVQKTVVRSDDGLLPRTRTNKYDYLSSVLLQSNYEVPLVQEEEEEDALYYNNYVPRLSSKYDRITSGPISATLGSEIQPVSTITQTSTVESLDDSRVRRIDDTLYSTPNVIRRSFNTPVLQTEEDITYDRYFPSLRYDRIGNIRQYESQPIRTFVETDIQSVPAVIQESVVETIDNRPYSDISQYNYVSSNNFLNDYELVFQNNRPIYNSFSTLSPEKSVTYQNQFGNIQDVLINEDEVVQSLPQTYGTVYQTYQPSIKPYETIQSTYESPVQSYDTLYKISGPSQKYYEPYIQSYQSPISQIENIYSPAPNVPRRKRRDVGSYESESYEIDSLTLPRSSRIHNDKVSLARQSPFDYFLRRDQSYRSPLETTQLDLDISSPPQKYQTQSTTLAPRLQERESIHLNHIFTIPSNQVLLPRLPTQTLQSRLENTEFNGANVLQNLDRTSVRSQAYPVTSLNRRLSNYDNIDGILETVYNNEGLPRNLVSRNIVDRPSLVVDKSIVAENVIAPSGRYLQSQTLRGPQVDTIYPTSGSFVIQGTQPAYSYSTPNYPFGSPFVTNPLGVNYPSSALTVTTSGSLINPLVNPYANAVSPGVVADTAVNSATLAAISSPLVQNRDALLISNAASDAAAAAAAANSAALDVANLVALLNSAYSPVNTGPATQVTTVDVVEQIPSTAFVQTVDVSAQNDPVTIAANAAAAAVASALSSGSFPITTRESVSETIALQPTNTLNYPINSARVLNKPVVVSESVSLSSANNPSTLNTLNPINTLNAASTRNFLGLNSINGVTIDALIANAVAAAVSSLLTANTQQGFLDSQASILNDNNLLSQITTAAINAALQLSGKNTLAPNSEVVTETISTSVLPLSYSSSVITSNDLLSNNPASIVSSIVEAISVALNRPSIVEQSLDTRSIQEVIASSVADVIQTSLSPVLRLSQSNAIDNAKLVSAQNPLANTVLNSVFANSPNAAAIIASDTAATEALLNALNPYLRNPYQRSQLGATSITPANIATDLTVTDSLSSDILASAIISALNSAQPNTVSALVSDVAAIEALSRILSNLPRNYLNVQEEVTNLANIESLLQALSLPIRGNYADNSIFTQLSSLRQNLPTKNYYNNPYLRSEKETAVAVNTASENLLVADLFSNNPYRYTSLQAILEGNARNANLPLLYSQALSDRPSNNVYYNTLNQPRRALPYSQSILSNAATVDSLIAAESANIAANAATAAAIDLAADSNTVYEPSFNPTSYVAPNPYQWNSDNVYQPNSYLIKPNKYPYSLLHASASASAQADSNIINPTHRYTSTGKRYNRNNIASANSAAAAHNSLPSKNVYTYPLNSKTDILRLEEEAIAADFAANVAESAAINAGNTNTLANLYQQVHIAPSASANAISTTSPSNYYNQPIVIDSVAGTRVTNDQAQATAAVMSAEIAAVEAAQLEIVAEKAAFQATYEAQQAELKKSQAYKNAAAAEKDFILAENQFEQKAQLVNSIKP